MATIRCFLRAGHRGRCLRSVGRFAGALFGGLSIFAVTARAQDATWLLNPGSGDFDTSANWTPAAVPTGTAIFGASNTTSITFSTDTAVGTLQFDAGAPAYSFELSSNSLELTGTGIVNNSSNVTTINNTGPGGTFFLNSSTAGNAAITNNVTNGGSVEFANTSTAGNATITNNGSGPGATFFVDTSTAGNATITNNGGAFVEFNDSSNAGSATVTTNSGSTTLFQNTASGGQARFITNAGGIFDISLLTSGGTTVGSIEGAGTYFLGANQLTVGSNNLSTVVSGTIQDGGFGGGTGGSLVKVGTGTLTLSGTNTYTGATTVDGGTLEVDGAIADTSSVTVNAGGRLSGTGTVDPATTTIMSGGTLSPGNAANPTGTLTITGSLMFQSAALYLVTVSGAGASSTNITGSASLGGTVEVEFASSPTAKSYDILHATGGLGGTTFGGLTGSTANYDASLSYSADDVFLNLTAALGASTPLNQNQQNVANAINTYFNSVGPLPTQFSNLFTLSGTQLENALTQLDGEDSTGAERGAFDLMNEFLGLMLDPFVYGRGGFSAGGHPLGFAPDQANGLPPDIALAYADVLKAPPPQSLAQRWTTWGSGFGGSAATNGDPTIGSNNVTTSTYGYAAGLDYHYSPDTVFGFSLAGGGTNWNLAQGLGTGRSDAFLAGVYGVTHEGPAYLAAALAFANNWFTTNRTALGDQLTANFQGQSYSARLEGGYRFAMPYSQGAAGVTPYAAIQTQDFQSPSYSETDLSGGGFGLSYNAMNGTDTRSELGSRFDDLTALNNLPLVLRAKVTWAHDWVSNPALNASFESLPGTAFTVTGAPIPRDSALTSAGAQLFFTPNWSLLAKFEGEFAPGSQTYAGTGTLRYTW